MSEETDETVEEPGTVKGMDPRTLTAEEAPDPVDIYIKSLYDKYGLSLARSINKLRATSMASDSVEASAIISAMILMEISSKIDDIKSMVFLSSLPPKTGIQGIDTIIEQGKKKREMTEMAEMAEMAKNRIPIGSQIAQFFTKRLEADTKKEDTPGKTEEGIIFKQISELLNSIFEEPNPSETAFIVIGEVAYATKPISYVMRAVNEKFPTITYSDLLDNKLLKGVRRHECRLGQ